MCLPYEPLKVPSDKHATWKTCFLLVLASAKRAIKLHGLSYQVQHSQGWKSCAFSFVPDFVDKTQNLSRHGSKFEELSIPFSDDFVGGDRDELVLCSIGALRRCLSCAEQYHSEFLNLLASVTNRKKQVSQKINLFWVRSVLSHTNGSASNEDCRLVRDKAHEVRKIATSLLFRRNCAVQQVLEGGIWSSQRTFLAFYLQGVTYRHMNTLSIGPVLAAQEVV